MTAILGCYALKGGVGKTSAAVNLAWLSAQDGRRTLLWDLDPQAAASFLLQAKPKVKGGTRKLLQGSSEPRDAVKATAYPLLDVLPAEVMYGHADLDLAEMKKPDRRIERVLRSLGQDTDVIVVDCPPGPSLLSANVVHAVDVLLVPIVPSPLSLRTLDQVTDFVASTGTTARVVAFLSMFDPRRALHRQVLGLVADRYGDVAHTVVPASAMVERMGQRRAPLGVWAGHTTAAAAYRALWEEVSARLPDAVMPTG